MSLPKAYRDIRASYPEVAAAYDALGDAAHRAGPLSDHERRLVKLALAIGAGHEGAAHSHTRQALEAGVDPEALRQVAVLAVTTLGFPTMVRAMCWVDEVIADRDSGA